MLCVQVIYWREAIAIAFQEFKDFHSHNRVRVELELQVLDFLNKSTLSELQSIKGIGQVYARRIFHNRTYQTYQDFRKLNTFGFKLRDNMRKSIEAKL